MMTRYQHQLFLSDVHFGAFSPAVNDAIEQDVLDLVGHCETNGIRLHILGDLFDYWMEYPNRIPIYGLRLLNRFRTYHEKVGPTFYITGNHDNWTKGAFLDAGFVVEPESVLGHFGNCRTLLLHGDGLQNGEEGLRRPLVNRLLRHSSFVKLYQTLLPERSGLALMKKFSSFNRRLRGKTNKSRLDQWVSRRLSDPETDLVICGHDHVARVETFRFGTYINLGNFYSGRTLAEYNNGVFRLVIWDVEDKQISPLKEYAPIHCDR